MRRALLSTILLLSAVLLAACGATSAVSSAASSSSHAYPLTLKTPSGNVKISARPTRILSLSASATQMLYAIGAGNQVIGVDKYSTYPADAPRTNFTGYETSAEDYVPKHPDLVLLAYNMSHMVTQLAALHIPALVLPPATTISGAEAQISELGKATGHEQGARDEISSLDKSLAKIVAPVGSRAKGESYYVELSPDYYSATSATFIGALFARLGMLNVANPAGKGSDYPQLSAEYLVKANPDYVFLADTVCCGQSETTFAKRPDFANLSAVVQHHVISVNDSLASQWGPHSMTTFLQLIVTAVNRSSATTGAS